MNTRILWIVSLLVVIAVAVALVRYVDGDVVQQIISRADWTYALGALAMVILLYVIECIQFWWTVSRTVKHLPVLQASRLFMASQPAMVFPAGILFRTLLLKREAGISMSASTPIILFHSALDLGVLIIAATVGAFYFEERRSLVLGIAAAAAVLSLLLYVQASRAVLVRLLERITAGRNLEEKLERFVRSVSFLLTPLITGVNLVFSGLAFFAAVMTLWYLCRAFGLPIDLLTASVVLAFPSILGRISALPLGIGVLDATMVGALGVLAGVTLEPAVVIVGAYRIARFFFPVAVGSLIYFLIWLPHHHRHTED